MRDGPSSVSGFPTRRGCWGWNHHHVPLLSRGVPDLKSFCVKAGVSVKGLFFCMCTHTDTHLTLQSGMTMRLVMKLAPMVELRVLENWPVV